MATQSAARKAWNEAMKATAGSAALPPSLQTRPHKRRSDRHKKNERRVKARKILTTMDGGGGGGCDGGENDEYRAAVWMDALEGVDPMMGMVDDDEDYDEFQELHDNDSGGGKKGGRAKKRRGTSGGGGAGKNASKKKVKAGTLPKKFLPRSLASILLEEAGREDSVARPFLQIEARYYSTEDDDNVPPPPPRRKFCPVSGLPALYTEPKTRLPYSTFRAWEQIRERPPPWMTLSGAAAYMESVKSILDT